MYTRAVCKHTRSHTCKHRSDGRVHCEPLLCSLIYSIPFHSVSIRYVTLRRCWSTEKRTTTNIRSVRYFIRFRLEKCMCIALSMDDLSVFHWDIRACVARTLYLVWRYDVILVVKTKAKAYWIVIEIYWFKSNELGNGILNHIF